jgi:hypothetical protein
MLPYKAIFISTLLSIYPHRKLDQISSTINNEGSKYLKCHFKYARLQEISVEVPFFAILQENINMNVERHICPFSSPLLTLFVILLQKLAINGYMGVFNYEKKILKTL